MFPHTIFLHTSHSVIQSNVIIGISVFERIVPQPLFAVFVFVFAVFVMDIPPHSHLKEWLEMQCLHSYIRDNS